MRCNVRHGIRKIATCHQTAQRNEWIVFNTSNKGTKDGVDAGWNHKSVVTICMIHSNECACYLQILYTIYGAHSHCLTTDVFNCLILFHYLCTVTSRTVSSDSWTSRVPMSKSTLSITTHPMMQCEIQWETSQSCFLF